MRAYSIATHAWYADTALAGDRYVEQIMVGDYNPDGGTKGEFALRWYDLQGGLAARVEMFEDAWHLHAEFRDLFDALAAMKSTLPQPDDIVTLLDSLGFTDHTDREHPYKDALR